MGVTDGPPVIHLHDLDNMGVGYKDEAKEKGCGVYDLINADVEKTALSTDLSHLPWRTPHLDPDCRGVLFGLSSMHTKADIVCAVMEGMLLLSY